MATRPSALLLFGAGVQVIVGLVLAPPWRWSPCDLSGRPALFTTIAYVIDPVATIGYVLALPDGPVTVVVPLLATSPSLAGLLGMFLLKERLNRRQLTGIRLALVGAALLSAGG